MGRPTRTTPSAARPPSTIAATRAAEGTGSQTTVQDAKPLLIVFDKPGPNKDVFVVIHPGKKPKTVHRADKLIAIDDAHWALEMKGIPDNRSMEDLYSLVQKRDGTALHVVFQLVNGPLLTRAKQGPPMQRRKQYWALSYKSPSTTKDPDLRAELPDYRRAVAIDPVVD